VFVVVCEFKYTIFENKYQNFFSQSFHTFICCCVCGSLSWIFSVAGFVLK
jgi:hypothetical protein